MRTGGGPELADPAARSAKAHRAGTTKCGIGAPRDSLRRGELTIVHGRQIVHRPSSTPCRVGRGVEAKESGTVTVILIVSAFDIAGRGIADSRSLEAAIKVAVNLVNGKGLDY